MRGPGLLFSNPAHFIPKVCQQTLPPYLKWTSCRWRGTCTELLPEKTSIRAASPSSAPVSLQAPCAQNAAWSAVCTVPSTQESYLV